MLTYIGPGIIAGALIAAGFTVEHDDFDLAEFSVDRGRPEEIRVRITWMLLSDRDLQSGDDAVSPRCPAAPAHVRELVKRLAACGCRISSLPEVAGPSTLTLHRVDRFDRFCRPFGTRASVTISWSPARP